MLNEAKKLGLGFNIKEFKKLSLEERAKIWLKDYYENDDFKYKYSLKMIINIAKYLEEKKYISKTYGISESGKEYKITNAGLIFILENN